MEWIADAKVWDRWQTLVNAVMNMRVPYNTYVKICTVLFI